MGAFWAVLDLSLHVVLTSIPVVAALLLAARFGVKDRLLLLSIGLCGLLVTGYVTFWVFLASPEAGTVFSIFLTATLAGVVVALGLQLREALKSLAKELVKPFLLWIVASLLIFSFGSAYGANLSLTAVAGGRFSHPLPNDNSVPLILANALQADRRPLPKPLYSDWDSSDRPPLQAGLYLSQASLLPGQDKDQRHYEILGIVLQGLWIFGLWGLLTAVGARSRLVALTLTATLFSGFILVNTYYTWPKLFPAAYLALLAALLITPVFKSFRGSAIAGATAGALAAAALLGHEGSILALAAFAVVMLLQRQKPSKRFAFAAISVIVITQGSWMLYQRVYDPPGDQLARLEIANQPKLYAGDPRSLPTVIISAYESKSLGTIVHNKLSNVVTPFRGARQYLLDSGRLIETYLSPGKGSSTTRKAAVYELQFVSFFYLLPSVGFLSLGFPAWLVAVLWSRRRPNPRARLAGTIWVFLIANITIWGIVLFGPHTTYLHAGSYVTGLLTFTACVIGLWELSQRIATAIVAIQVALTVVVYGLNGQLPTPIAHTPPIDAQMLGLTICALLLTIGAIAFIATENQPGPLAPVHELA